jgi:exodeoxyribonuclease VII large subunit
LVYVEGEISNLTIPASGHAYFTLKDQQAQIRCALFKTPNSLRDAASILASGQKVLVKAHVSLYIPRGDYQLIVQHVYPTGLGALQLAYHALYQTLKNEGLFDPQHKKPIPSLPESIGVITSTTGAAIQDVLSTLNRRFPCIPVFVFPSPVQGSEAAPLLIKALHKAQAYHLQTHPLDVLLIVRGGGSLEDLWCFNDESLARAVYHCPIPIITGVGHETDVTLIDAVADLRAATPTAAAEHAVPLQETYRKLFKDYEKALFRAIQLKLTRLQQQQAHLAHRLTVQHPQAILTAQMQRLDEYTLRLQRAYQRQFEQNTQQLKALIQKLNALSPLSILQRGYSILTQEEGTCITQTQTLHKGDILRARLYQGHLSCQIIDLD